jgi:hypothetical protein
MIEAAPPEAQHNAQRGSRPFYVYFCNGDITTVHPATEVAFSRDHLVVYDRKCIVATFPRSKIYFVSDELIPPVSF